MADPFARFGYKRPDEYLGDVGRGILSQYQDYFDPFTKDDSGKYYAEQPLAPPTEKTPQVTKDWLPNAMAAADIASTVLPQGMLAKGATAAATHTLPSLASSILGFGTRRRKLPPMVEVLHGTGSPAEYVRPSLPPPEHDLGIHTTINPNITTGYAFKHDTGGIGDDTVDFMSGKKFGDPDAAGPRVKPFLMDAKSALKYPADAIKWNDPNRVVGALAKEMRSGFIAPRGLLSDLHNISSSDKMWQDQFIPMLKDKGYDSLVYPHYDMGGGTTKYNTMMAFDPEQLTPRYSPEAERLIKERGIKGAIKDVRDFDEDEGVFREVPRWVMPQGVLKKPTEIESLVRLPSHNTVHWWEDPNSPLSKIAAKEKADFEKSLKETAEADKKFIEFHKQEAAKHGVTYTPAPPGPVSSQNAALNMLKWEQEKLKTLLGKGKINDLEYKNKFDYYENLKDQHYGKMVNEAALLPKGMMGNPDTNYPVGVLNKYKYHDHAELAKAHKAGEINDGLYNKLLNDISGKGGSKGMPMGGVSEYQSAALGKINNDLKSGKISADEFNTKYKKIFPGKIKVISDNEWHWLPDK